MGRLFGLLIVLAAIALGVAYIGSPWLAFRQLGEAAQAGDQDRLEALIDYPVVREGMKHEVDSGPTKLSRTLSGVGFAPVQAVGKLGAMHGDRKIRKLIAPSALAGLVRGDPSYSYLTPDRVRISVVHPAGPPAGFVLERRGLFGWKLVKLELPGEKVKPADG